MFLQPTPTSSAQLVKVSGAFRTSKVGRGKSRGAKNVVAVFNMDSIRV